MVWWGREYQRVNELRSEIDEFRWGVPANWRLIAGSACKIIMVGAAGSLNRSTQLASNRH